MKTKDTLVGIIFIFLLGSLFHFTFELSNNNIIVSLFSGINESTFEHMKLLLYPIIIWYVIYYFKNYTDTNKDVLFSSMITNIIVSIISIPIIFYTLNGIFGKTSLLVDILIFLISIIIGMYHANINYLKRKRLPWKIILGLIIIIFSYFTFNPLNIPLFNF